MANIKSAKKDAVQSKRNKIINSSRKTILRRLMKKFSEAVLQKDKELANILWLKLQSNLDKFSQKGLIHKNKAARYKSRFYLKVKTLV
ncbi:30S ribosomal protein S20 [Buchnera aphidicola]|uniref:Small ribosomal subunit protein bS20 n=1 Tax=Buchnera aphidicola (Sarucallis kahawaluokalani) TaxID=1241878 RepID=A0A4D6Y8D1_9GAMM|nr:30S ribosomal protein S20 [Buchnera aphidicola]QCI25907.1 30S ribosomal protein S20 [Buchnera aphidicola (Sarucallis kahawaluokalani)]